MTKRDYLTLRPEWYLITLRLRKSPYKDKKLSVVATISSPDLFYARSFGGECGYHCRRLWLCARVRYSPYSYWRGLGENGVALFVTPLLYTLDIGRQLLLAWPTFVFKTLKKEGRAFRNIGNKKHIFPILVRYALLLLLDILVYSWWHPLLGSGPSILLRWSLLPKLKLLTETRLMKFSIS